MNFPPSWTAIVGSENEPFAQLMQIISRHSSPRCGGELRLRIAASRPYQAANVEVATRERAYASRLDAARFEMFLS
jgi:hypothetical protein